MTAFSSCAVVVRKGGLTWVFVDVGSVPFLVYICAGFSVLVCCLETGIIALTKSLVVLLGYCGVYWMKVTDKHNNTTK